MNSELVLGAAVVFVLPVIYLIHHSYRLYIGRLKVQKERAEELAALHSRTIEALVLAIEAKDHARVGA